MMACITGSPIKPLSLRTTSSSRISSQLRTLATARQVRWSPRASGGAQNLSMSSSTLPFKTSPWLMLPPKDPKLNRFYSLEEKIVIPIKKSSTTTMVDDEPLCVGSSHGWLFYINRTDNGSMFLYNPISHRLVKLPSIDTLPIGLTCKPYINIERLILSSPPIDEDEDDGHNRCIALCILEGARDLAFCRPGQDTSWIPLGEDFDCYEQVMYSSRNKLFYCFSDVYNRLDGWDLGDPYSPKRELVMDLVKEEEEQHERETPMKTYLIADPGEDDSIFLIERFIACGIDEDGSPVDFHAVDYSYPYKTLFFKVYKLDLKNGRMKYMKHSLNDRIFFVGMNQSFSLPACDFPHLTPNSIYFTDDWADSTWDASFLYNGSTAPYGGHDVGIFNYQDKSFESCYYSCDVKSIQRIMPPPIWYTPDPRNPLPHAGNYAFLFDDDGTL